MGLGQRTVRLTTAVLAAAVVVLAAVSAGGAVPLTAYWPLLAMLPLLAWSARVAWPARSAAADVQRAPWPVTVAALAWWLLGYVQIGTFNRERPMHDAVVIAWEARWFGDPAHAWHAQWPSPALSVLLNGCYLAYYGVVLVPFLRLWWQRRWDALGVTTLAFTLTLVTGFLCFLLWPVEGPRYRAPLPSSALPDVMHGAASWILAEFSSRGTAFPSSHMSLAITQVVLAWHLQRPLAFVLLPVTAGIGLGAVYGGFHYLLDVLVGAVLGFLVGLAVVRWAARTASASA